MLTGASSVPVTYWQGLTSDPAEANLYFVGVFEGLWRTTPQLRQTAGVPNAIPDAVQQAEGYNHIGDPTWNPGEGGRVLLPMECFTPGSRQYLRHRRVRRRGPRHAGLPLLRKARPSGDPEGDVGRDLARRLADLDQQR